MKKEIKRLNKKLFKIFDIIQKLEIEYGLVLEIKVIKPKMERGTGKGIAEALIGMQQKVNKELK